MIYVGIDWAEAHHDVCVLDEEGGILAKGRVTDDLEGVARLHEMAADHAEEPSEVMVGIETDRGLLIGSLVASADAAAEPSTPDPRLAGPGGRLLSTPALPQVPASTEDRHFHLLVRALLEDLATAPRNGAFDEEDVLTVLAAVDTLPVGYRTTIGKTLLEWLPQVQAQGEGVVGWRLRRINFPDRPHLIFAAATRWDEAVRNAFSMLVEIRHTQRRETVSGGHPLTVGVLLTPRLDGRRSWDTTLVAVRGDLQLGPEYRAKLEELWPENLTSE